MLEGAILAGFAQIVATFEEILRGGPTPARLAAASWIHDWTPVTRGRDIPSLYGRIAEEADPDAPGREMATADLLHLDPERGLARTREGWLRLGARADAMRRAWMRETFGDGTGPLERLMRDMGEGVWPIEDAALDAMLAAWPGQMLDALSPQQSREAPDLSRRLEAVLRAWPDRAGAH